MGDRSNLTISVSIPIHGLEGEPWKSLDALEDRLRRLLDAKGIPSDISTYEALSWLAVAKDGTLEWHAFHALGSIDACRECLKLGHHEASTTYAMQAVAMGMRADPRAAEAVMQIHELKMKQRAGGQKGAPTRKKRTEILHEVWIRNARDLLSRYPDWSSRQISQYLAQESDRSARTIYDVIRPALKADCSTKYLPKQPIA